ncbi:MAG: hypothetical protein KKA10_06780 [Euryarchaeota archaeon]|nr:hypothetical protein [Euryarchaeota archaeon]MBU4453480.1 hypothetical protein [Euryarchaeota archaeon]MDP3103677.1 hypothetical protein [Candidatus Methanoperedens sp.]
MTKKYPFNNTPSILRLDHADKGGIFDKSRVGARYCVAVRGHIGAGELIFHV